MKIIEPGHIYEFPGLDSRPGTPPHRITYVNRETGTEHPGIQSQDSIRSLIDRTQHCDQCLRWEGNDLIIHHLRMALVLHECRALLRKVEKGQLQPERVEVSEDGHFALLAAPQDPKSASLGLPGHPVGEIYSMAQVPDEEKPRHGKPGGG